MGILNKMATSLLLPLAFLTGCSGSSNQTKVPTHAKAAHNIYVVDVSVSPATMTNEAVFHAVETRIGEDMKREAKLGDSFSVYEAGNSDAARMIGHPPITTGYQLRIPTAHVKLVGQLREVYQRVQAHGGDDATQLVQSLEVIRPDCSSGRDTITLVGDGLEENGDMSSARALAAGTPIRFSPPPGRYLARCHRIIFLGFGLTDDGTGKARLLPAPQLSALRQAWIDYLIAAGVAANDVVFVSAL